MSAGLSKREQQIWTDIEAELGHDRHLQRCMRTGRTGWCRALAESEEIASGITVILLLAAVAIVAVALRGGFAVVVLPAVVVSAAAALAAAHWHRIWRAGRRR